MEASSEFFIGSYFAHGPDPARTQFDTNNVHSNNNVNNSNHFTVDDLLDFSKEDEAMTDAFFESLTGNSADDSTVTAVDSCNSSVSGGDTTQFNGNLSCRSFTDVQISGSELCVPYDDLAELEWLSNFVEESFSSDDMQLICTAKLPSTTTSAAAATDVSSTSSTISTKNSQNSPPIFPSDVSVPGKARSKRSRAAPCDWSSRLLLVSPATSSSENNEPTSINQIINIDNNSKQAKTTSSKRRDSTDTPGRKCLHCGSEKTPQWRAGPLGPKTLCNACGVRYKSGRLVPEYRPATSPTFVSTKHSNSHRKVLELRRQKELQRQQAAAQQLLTQHAIFGASNGADNYLIHHQQQMDVRDFRHMI